MSGCDNFDFEAPQDEFAFMDGLRGADGTTFYPHVSADGVLSWTNDGGKPNPDPVNIKGADGKSAYQAAVEAGFSGTEAEFNEYLSNIGVLTDEVADQKSLISGLAALTNRKAGMLVDTASGAVASFVPDSTISDLLGVTVDVEPVQDLHGYDSPWPAGGGKNVMPPAAAGSQERYGITVTSDGNGKYTCVGTATDSVTFSFSVPEFVIPPSAERTVCFMNSAAIGTFIFMNGNTVVDSWQLSNINRTAETYYAMANITCNRIRIDFGGGTTVNMTLSPMFLAKNEDTSVFVPYSNECPISGWDAVSIWNKPTHDTSADPTVTIQIGQTVYGGTLDVTGGTMTVDRKIIDCASITTWTIDKSAKRIYKIMSELAPASAAAVVADGLICNRFKSITANQIYANDEGVAISIGSALQFRINGLTDNPDVTLADVSSYFTANETKVVAKLATPIEITLTPTQISAIAGQTNNVWSDAGDVSVTYAADLKHYIDSKIAAAVAALS